MLTPPEVGCGGADGGAGSVSRGFHVPESQDAEEQWCFQLVHCGFGKRSNFSENLTGRGSFPRGKSSICTNGISSLLLGSKWISNRMHKVAAEGANSGSWEGGQ